MKLSVSCIQIKKKFIIIFGNLFFFVQSKFRTICNNINVMNIGKKTRIVVVGHSQSQNCVINCYITGYQNIYPPNSSYQF